MGVQKPDIRVLLNVSVIVLGVIIASIGEIKFVLIGVLFQIGGIVFEAIRLVMVERLLSSAEYKMDPLVSLYYFAPICAVMNFCTALVFEIPRIQLAEIYFVGVWNLLGNACLAFALNVSVVFLASTQPNRIGIVLTSFTDRTDIRSGNDPLRRVEGHSARRRLNRNLGHSHIWTPILRIRHRTLRTHLLQARRCDPQGPICGAQPLLGRIWRQASGHEEIDRLCNGTNCNIPPHGRSGSNNGIRS